MKLSRYGKSLARALLHGTGALSGVRFWNRGAFRILMYHDFPSIPNLKESFAVQCAHIARHYELVSMDDIGRYLREGKSLPKNALAVTVDDGNRDFLQNAYPIFKAHKVPVTVYLVSGFLDGKLWLWWDQIRYLMERTQAASFELAIKAGQPVLRFDSSSAEQRERAISILSHAMKMLNHEDRESMLSRFGQQLKVVLPVEPPAAFAPMTWSEVREITAFGIDIGAHTVSHPALSRLWDPAELLHEINFSKRRIEAELKRPVRHFCYPYGQREDLDEASRKVFAECYFQTAVTALHGLNYRDSDPFRLARLSVDAMMPEFYFKERLAGLHAG